MRATLISFVLGSLIAANVAPAHANVLCRTELPDGRIFLSQPMMGHDGMFCRSPDVFDRRHDVFGDRHAPATPALPHMSLTTPMGPFTTGEIGPFTTFSNSPPAHRR